jgi:anti-sigma factor RsiW
MECIEARKKLKEYVNDEIINNEERLQIEAHVKDCPVCQREMLMWQEVMDKQRAVSRMQAGMSKELKDRLKYRMVKAEKEAAVPQIIKRMKAISGIWGPGKGRLIMLVCMIFAALIFILKTTNGNKGILAPALILFGFSILFYLMLFKGKK